MLAPLKCGFSLLSDMSELSDQQLSIYCWQGHRDTRSRGYSSLGFAKDRKWQVASRAGGLECMGARLVQTSKRRIPIKGSPTSHYRKEELNATNLFKNVSKVIALAVDLYCE